MVIASAKGLADLLAREYAFGFVPTTFCFFCAISNNNFERLSMSFLIVRNRDFDEKYPPTTNLIGYSNITILYS